MRPLIATATSAVIPSAACLDLHRLHREFRSFDEFQPVLAEQISRAAALDEALACIRMLGLLEPLSGQHIRPEEILIDGSNYRETIIAQGCQSRSRAVMLVLESIYGSLEELASQHTYLPEMLSGFSKRLRHWIPDLVLSEYLHDAPADLDDQLLHQEITALSFADGSFDLVLVHEIFEHVFPLERALAELHRVLKPTGRLISTFPFAYGQQEMITKAIRRDGHNEVEHLCEPDYHGDPLRPQVGAMVFQIPGWSILDQLKAIGFSKTVIHYICSWKYGVLGCDVPGVFVLEAQV